MIILKLCDSNIGWLLQLIRFSREEQALFNASGSFNYVSCGSLYIFLVLIYHSLKVKQKIRQIFAHVAKSIHFHLFRFINVAAITFILTVYLTPFKNFMYEF